MKRVYIKLLIMLTLTVTGRLKRGLFMSDKTKEVIRLTVQFVVSLIATLLGISFF